MQCHVLALTAKLLSVEASHSCCNAVRSNDYYIKWWLNVDLSKYIESSSWFSFLLFCIFSYFHGRLSVSCGVTLPSSSPKCSLCAYCTLVWAKLNVCMYVNYCYISKTRSWHMWWFKDDMKSSSMCQDTQVTSRAQCKNKTQWANTGGIHWKWVSTWVSK